jgi:excisionase family DNA binding protein
MAGKRRFNPRLAKIHRCYTIDEVARQFGVHKQTVRNWIDAGLPVLASKRPILIHGSDLRGFHEERRQKRKQKCRPGELFCLKCRAPKRPAGDMLDYLPMSLVSGNFRGICPTCDGLIHRRVSLAKIDAAKGNCTVEYPHGQKRLINTPDPSLDCHLAAPSSDHGKA